MEYHKIETLYERDETTHRLKPELILKNATYGLLKSWQFTEKIDGTNIRCIWDHLTGKLTFGGKMTLEAATEMVRTGFQSRLNGGKMKSEGLVGRPQSHRKTGRRNESY